MSFPAASNTKEAMKAAGAGSSDLWQVSLDNLHVDPEFNVRIKDERYQSKVREIADSIKANGYRRDKPITGYVAGGKIWVTDGHRRREAAMLAISEGVELGPIPVIVEPRGTSQEDLIVGLAVANSGEPLSPFELGVVFKRLIHLGWPEEKVSERCCYSVAYVRQMLDLQAAPAEIRQMVIDGKMSADLAIGLLRNHGEAAVAEAKKAVEKAAGEGRKKATAKDVVGANYKRAVSKEAPAMHQALLALRRTGGAKISDDVWSMISDILDRLDSVEMPNAD